MIVTCMKLVKKKQETLIFVTRNSAIVEKPRDAFKDQSRSPNIIPFDMLGVVSY